jgi:AraC-like DNA-binding protein
MWVLVRNGLEATEKPGLGLRFGQRVNINDHGVFGYALMSSSTLGEALNLVMRYHRILVPEMHVELRTSQDSVALRCRAKQFTPQVERFFLESFFAAVINSAAFLIHGEQVEITQQFDFPMPLDPTPYYEVFGENLEFGAAVSQILVPVAKLDTPISTANPAVEAIFREQCDTLLRQLGGSEAVSARVQQVLLHSRGDFPDIAAVSAQLHMSESTLRRRLRQEGSGFRPLLDQVRLHLASQYLRETDLPVAEIGRLLGFDDVTNFRRAFGRWSGTTPSQMRLSRVAGK